MSREQSASRQQASGVDGYARRVRLMVIGGVFLMFALVGALIGIPWLIGDPLPVIRPDSGAQIPAEVTDETQMVARIQVHPGGQTVIVVRDLTRGGMMTPTNAAFASLEGGSLRIDVPLERIDQEHARGRAVLDLPGRWELQVEHATGVERFAFVLAEF